MRKDIAVVMTGWKRNYFAEQLAALRAQSVPPTNYYLYQNGNHLDLDTFCAENGIVLSKSRHDFKFFGRFTLPCLLEDEYCLVIDDDVIPGTRWIENCLRCEQEHGGACGAEGRIFKTNGRTGGLLDLWYMTESGEIPDTRDVKVDFILHAYFFRTEWIRHFWSLRPASFVYGEDFHFSGALRRAGIHSYSPRATCAEERGNTRREYGFDAHATWSQESLDTHRIRRQSFIDWATKNQVPTSITGGLG